MCDLGHSIFDLPGSLNCLGVGPGHARQYEASSVGDGHDLDEAAAESGRG